MPAADDDGGDPRPRASAAAVLPNLITIGNAVCGFLALTHIAGVRIEDGHPSNLEYLNRAAWFILLGMVFDVFDGRVARLTGATSALGAQLDSFCDLVTFGLAPAGLMVKLHSCAYFELGTHAPWGKIVWALGLLFFLGAMLRLARFNVDHEPGADHHLCFMGMPTPAAAGTVAALVLCYFWLKNWKSWELLMLAPAQPEWAQEFCRAIIIFLPFVTPLLGYAMVSTRFNYPHVASRLLVRRDFDHLVWLIFGAILLALTAEPVLAIGFLGYMAWTPICVLIGKLKGWRASPA